MDDARPVRLPRYRPGDRVLARYDHPAWPDVEFTIRHLVVDYAGKGPRYYGVDSRGVTHTAVESQMTLISRDGERPVMSDALRDIEWVYGSIRASGSQPVRHVFERLADEQGVDPSEFSTWAEGVEWR